MFSGRTIGTMLYVMRDCEDCVIATVIIVWMINPWFVRVLFIYCKCNAHGRLRGRLAHACG